MKRARNLKVPFFMLLCAFLCPPLSGGAREEIDFTEFSRAFSAGLNSIFKTDYQVEVEAKKLRKPADQFLLKQNPQAKLKLAKIILTCQGGEKMITLTPEPSGPTTGAEDMNRESLDNFTKTAEYEQIRRFFELKLADYESILNLLNVEEEDQVDFIVNNQGNIEFEINHINEPWGENQIIAGLHVETSYRHLSFLSVLVNFTDGKFLKLKFNFTPMRTAENRDPVYLISEIYIKHNLPPGPTGKISDPPKHTIVLKNYKFPPTKVKDQDVAAKK